MAKRKKRRIAVEEEGGKGDAHRAGSDDMCLDVDDENW
jgi:hypothetical protein